MTAVQAVRIVSKEKRTTKTDTDEVPEQDDEDAKSQNLICAHSFLKDSVNYHTPFKDTCQAQKHTFFKNKETRFQKF